MIERTFIEQRIRKLELEEFFKKELDRAGFTGLDIVKTPLVTRLILHVARPGFAIGKSGSTIRQLTLTVESRFGISNPQIEIAEIRNPDLNARVIVDRIKGLLERNYSWRSIGFKIVKDIQDAGAQGVELSFSGKLAGKGGRKRATRIAVGYMKKVGDQTKWVDFAKASAYPKAGAIGIKLRIIHPDVMFPDKANYKAILAEKLKALENPSLASDVAKVPEGIEVVEDEADAPVEETPVETPPVNAGEATAPKTEAKKTVKKPRATPKKKDAKTAAPKPETTEETESEQA